MSRRGFLRSAGKVAPPRARRLHGFNNDTTPRYDDAAARLAWQRTLALFDRTLRA